MEIACLALSNGLKISEVCCPVCGEKVWDDLADVIEERHCCSKCKHVDKSPQYVCSSPIARFADPDLDVLPVLQRKINRLGKMLVGNVSQQDEEHLFAFLWSIEDRVLIDKCDKLGLSKSTTFSIELIDENCKPVCHDVRRCSALKQRFIDAEIDKLLADDIIEPILTDWASGIVVVPKPGPGDDFRMCIDYVDLNRITKTVRYPIPYIEDIM